MINKLLICKSSLIAGYIQYNIGRVQVAAVLRFPSEKLTLSGTVWKALKKSGCLSPAKSGTSFGFLAFRTVTQSVFQGCPFLGSSFGQAKEEQ